MESKTAIERETRRQFVMVKKSPLKRTIGMVAWNNGRIKRTI